MTAGEAAVQGRRPLPFCREQVRASHARLFVFPQQNRLLRRRSRGASGSASSGPDSHSPARLRMTVLNDGDIKQEAIMTMVQSVGTAGDRVMAVLVAGLEIEFGRGAGEALAEHFLKAEESDFLWAARMAERWLGAYESIDAEGLDLDRIAIIGRCGRCWFVGVSIVDGDGNPQGLISRRRFNSEREARETFAATH